MLSPSRGIIAAELALRRDRNAMNRTGHARGNSRN